MPPAFNLSQDQTLQFDLEILLNGIEVTYHFSYRERLQVVRTCESFDSLALAFKRPHLSAVSF